jgi:16S rRNA (guanine(966)-N(2))-methyltransferase RsmD
MRVISGTCRGKKLLSPQGLTTRPTSDRVKESLFNIIGNYIDLVDTTVLDLCAGTGALGIEALSRGARFCSFVEYETSVLTILEKNLIITNLRDRSELVPIMLERALPQVADRGKKYDLVFFDPPYASTLYPFVFETLTTLGLLMPSSLVVAECSVRNQLQHSYGGLMRVDRRVYGETALELFILEE